MRKSCDVQINIQVLNFQFIWAVPADGSVATSTDLYTELLSDFDVN